VFPSERFLGYKVLVAAAAAAAAAAAELAEADDGKSHKLDLLPEDDITRRE